MYKTIIELKENISRETAKEIREICIAAHDNYAGEVQIKDISPRKFVFEGEQESFPCLQLGWLKLKKSSDFLKCAAQWLWEDNDPKENCDLMVELFKPVYGIKKGQ